MVVLDNRQVFEQKDIIEERGIRINQIENSAGQLNQLAGDVNVQIYQTGDNVFKINKNMDVAEEGILGANDEMEKALTTQRSSKKCQIWVFVAIAAVIGGISATVLSMIDWG
jgi:t-SNARE complex subunit (syntaxin)